MFRARVSTTRRDLQKKERRDETDRGRTQLLSTICRLDTCTLFRYHFPIQCDVHRIALRCSIIPCYSRSILSYINPSFDSYAKRIHRCIFSSASIEDGGGASFVWKKDRRSRISRGDRSVCQAVELCIELCIERVQLLFS